MSVALDDLCLDIDPKLSTRVRGVGSEAGVEYLEGIADFGIRIGGGEDRREPLLREIIHRVIE